MGKPRKLSRPRRTPVLYFPIAIKFAAFITLLVLSFMWWVTVRAVQVAEESQEKEVNQSGLKVVCTLAGLINPDWLKEARLQETLEDVLNRVLSDCRDLGIMDALVYDRHGNLIATGLKEKVVWMSQDPKEIHFPAAIAARVRIREFRYQGLPIRSFGRAIVQPSVSGQTEPSLGTIAVLLSADQIRQSREDMRQQMIALSAIACLGAALGSFLLAAWLTRPIRALAKDLRQVSLGDLEHRSPIRTGDEIGNLARAFNQMTENLEQAQEVLLAQKAAEHELALATRIQQSLLPRGLPQPAGFDLAAFSRPAREVGGDYYDFIPIDEEHLGIVIADVSGKGIPGSMIMTMTRSLLRMAARHSLSPVETLRQVHEELAPDLSPGLFVSLLYLVIDVPRRKVQLARAGHNSPLLFTGRHGKIHTLNPKGLALGLNPGKPLLESDLEMQAVALHPGDILVLYTDGITEEQNPSGQEYGLERLARAVVEHHRLGAQGMVEAVLADLELHCQGGEQVDDRTLVVVKGLPEEAAG
ncbi:MAG: SpoIIE family protein phosphatase [Planctomycetes bacterium]|nr:SpoIIE family protein phosphatase [Planctomycetota bacterium]